MDPEQLKYTQDVNNQPWQLWQNNEEGICVSTLLECLLIY